MVATPTQSGALGRDDPGCSIICVSLGGAIIRGRIAGSRTVAPTRIEELTDRILLAAVVTEHLDIDEYGVRADRQLVSTVKSAERVVCDGFEPAFETLNGFAVVGESFGWRPVIGWRRHRKHRRQKGMDRLVGDEIPPERVDIDIGAFETAAGLGLHSGTHRVVGQQPVGVFGFAFERVESGVSHCGSHNGRIESVCERPEALAFVSLSAPAVGQFLAEAESVRFTHATDFFYHRNSPPRGARCRRIVPTEWGRVSESIGSLSRSRWRPDHRKPQVDHGRTPSMTASPLDRLRRPEYTGDRRCWPCTALNFVLVVGVAAPIGFVLLPAGFVVFVIGVTLIALRGYVVPYTPQFAPRLTAQLPGDFGPTQADPRSDPLVVVDDPAQLLGRLLAAGVIVEDDALFLTSTFEADWERRMATLREASDEAVAAAVADAAPFEASSLVSQERLLVAGENRRDSWLSRPVAVATATGIEALVDYGIDRSVAAAAVEPLRMFLTTCPDCGEPTEESTVHNCCGGTKGVYDRPEREVLACESCEAVLYEFPLADRASD